MLDHRTLLVFAHCDEASAFADVPHLVTGVGKINAASALAQALVSGLRVANEAAGASTLAAVGARAANVPAAGSAAKADATAKDAAARGTAADRTGPGELRADEPGGIDRVVVLGTAGVIGDEPGAPTLDTVCQVTAAEQHDFSLPSPRLTLGGAVILPEDETAVIATGDVFVQDDEQRRRIAARGATLVDMEAYAYASVCERFDVPLQMFKVPSDFADSGTSGEDWDTIVFRKSEQLRAFWEGGLAGI